MQGPAAKFVSPVVTAYLQGNPAVVATCRFLDRVVSMLDGGADVGIRIGELPDSSMQATSVGRVRRVICAAPACLQQHGVHLTPAGLQPLLGEFELPWLPVQGVHREGQHASRKARAFIDLVVERLRADPALGSNTRTST